MNRAVRIGAAVLGSILGLVLIVVVAALFVVRTGWFQNFAREEIISSVEDSTGGKVELQSFQFDSSRMTATVSGFILHGTEPVGSAPLFRADRVILSVKLFTALRKAFVLEYLGVEHPSANVIAFADGRTNIPDPKKKSTSNKSGLETIVNLAIRRMELNRGTIHFLDQTMPVDVRGTNLRVMLAYNLASTHYQGELSMEPLLTQSPGRPPLEAKIDIPVDLGADAIQITNARIATPQSTIYVNASVQHMAAPMISAQVVAHVGLDELSRSLELPIHPKPGLNSVEATVAIETHDQSMQIRNALLTLGHTQISASGDLRKGAQIQAQLMLDELGTLLALAQRPSGSIQMVGTAQVPANGPFVLNGSVSSRGLAYDQFRDIKLAGGFRVDPNTIAMNGLTVNVLGGELRADARLENAKTYSLNGTVRNFTIEKLTTALMHKPIGYAGAIGGNIDATGALKGSVQARARLKITPAGRGVPVSGDLNASYDGAQDLISLDQSRISLPNTRIDFTGLMGRTADVRVESRNLDDFAPLADLGSTVRLKGGVGTLAIHEAGPLSNPQISGRVQLTKITLQDRLFDQLSADLRASPSNAVLENGLLKRNGSQAQFSGSLGLKQWKVLDNATLSAKLTTNNTDVADLLALAGTDARVTGPLTANVAIGGTLANPQGSAQVTAGPGTAYDEPYDRAQLVANLADQRVDLQTLEVHAGEAQFQARGSFTHPRDSFTTGRIQLHAATNQIQLSQFKTLDQQRPGIAGAVVFDSDVLGELRKEQGVEFVPSAVNARLTASGVRDKSQTYGDLNASASTYGSDLNTRVDSDFAGSQIQIRARTQLKSDFPTVADATIRSLQIEKALALASSGAAQVKGTLSAQAHFTGTMKDPHADVSFDVSAGTAFDETITRLDARASYSNQLVTLSSLNLSSPAGAIQIQGSFAHNTGDFHNGKIEAHVNAPGVRLERIQHVVRQKPGFSGSARLVADVAGELRGNEVLPTRAEIKGGLDDLQLNKNRLGGLNFEGHTSSDTLAMRVDAEIAGSQLRGTGQVQLGGDYNGNARLTLNNVKYSSFQALLGSEAPFEAALEAQADFSGPFRRPLDATGNVQISRLELSAIKNPVSIHNEGPIAIRLNHSEIEIANAKLTGPSTNIDLGGKVALNRANPLDLKVTVNTDLAVLKNFERSAYSDGTVSANATVRGTFASPQVNGRIDLKNASLQLADWPNGISNANGSILLNGTNARVNSLTAESGGGKLTIDGSAGFTGSTLDFDLRVNAQNVRTRYSGASVGANAALTMTGTTERGVLGGTVTITRVGYTSQGDIGAILTGASTPPSAPAAPGLASRIRLNIRVQTAPGVRFQTNLAEQLSASADLRVLGNLQTPGMVGRVNVSAGTLIFFGNKYTVNRGSVAFYNASAIQPILDIDLETAAQGVNVDLSVSGPIDNMKLSYRSDPPLKFEDIVALLATGRTPADPTIAVNQPAPPEQNAMQMGESAIVGQAVANPVANRLQRVFGVSQFKLSPTFVAGSTLPQARVTLQQQVSNTITFTYSQDLSLANSQLIRVELQMTPRFSAVATRDENGIFGVDFFYKKQFR